MIAAGSISPPSWMTSDATRALFGALTANGVPARFVGGCVRDGVLGRPVKDIDIATPATPEDVIRLLDTARIRSVLTGIDHGTITAVIEHEAFEVTTLRRDVKTDGRHAVVVFTNDWEADAARRDFTMNALFCDADGTLFDPTGGLEDLRAGRVRFVGSARARITEDVLRLLRFFRFHAWYGREGADADALAACQEMAPALSGLSAERVWAEISRTFLAPDPSVALRLMVDTGVLPHVLTEARHPDRLKPAVAAEARLGLPPSSVRRLAAVIASGPDNISGLNTRLRMARADAERLAAAIEHAAVLRPDMEAAEIRAALYRWGAPSFADALVVAVAANPSKVVAWDGLATALADWEAPAFPLSGSDVLAAGVPAGKHVGDLLEAVEQWWLYHGFAPDRDKCLARLVHLIRG